MKNLIILLTGEARSGKDTTADILTTMLAQRDIKICRTYFAKALKESAKVIFDLTDEHVFGALKEEPMIIRITQQELYRGLISQLREGHLKFIPPKMPTVPIHIIAQQIMIKMLTAMLTNAEWVAPCIYRCSPRQIMQWWGTEAIRQGAYDGAWIDAVKADIEGSGAQVSIISDARFDNEIVEIKKSHLQDNVITVKLHRGDKQTVAHHVSEAGVSEYLVTYSVANDGSIEELAAKLHDVLFDDEIISGDLLWLDN